MGPPGEEKLLNKSDFGRHGRSKVSRRAMKSDLVSAGPHSPSEEKSVKELVSYRLFSVQVSWDVRLGDGIVNQWSVGIVSAPNSFVAADLANQNMTPGGSGVINVTVKVNELPDMTEGSSIHVIV